MEYVYKASSKSTMPDLLLHQMCYLVTLAIQSWTLYSPVGVCRQGLIPGPHATICLHFFSVSAPETVYSMCALLVCSFNCVSYCKGVLSNELHSCFKLKDTWHVSMSLKSIQWGGHCLKEGWLVWLCASSKESDHVLPLCLGLCGHH